MTIEEMLREFHSKYDCHIGPEPAFPPIEVIELRLSLIQEELKELDEALIAEDIVGVADAITDLLYVVAGTGISFGLPVDRLLKEVHSSNMSKLDEHGNPIKREDGKVLKGPHFFEPRIEDVLNGRDLVFEEEP